MKCCETGRSMIEMLGVLAIIGVLSVGGMMGYSKMMNQHKINSSLEQIGIISAKISAYGSGADSYDGLDISSAIKLGAVPSSAVDGSALINPYGGNTYIRSSWIDSTASSTDKQAYIIVYTNLDEEACVALGSSAWGNVRNSTFIGLGVGKVRTNSVDGDIKTLEKLLYMGCPGVTDSSSYAVACSGGSVLAPPMDAGTAALACECPDTDCAFIMKFF